MEEIRKKLIESAKLLKIPCRETIEEYSFKKDILVTHLNKIMSTQNDIISLIGENNLEMMANNHKNHVLFIENILNNFDAEIFVNTIIWVYKTYRSHGFNTIYWQKQIELWIKLFNEFLSEKSASEIITIYKWILTNHNNFILITDDYLK